MPTDPTPKKKGLFLKAFEDTHLVTESAKRAGIHRSTAYEWREHDEAFARDWADVEERSTELLEQIAVRRAAQGSDTLLIFLLKARRPDVYREHHTVKHEGAGKDGAMPVTVSVDVSKAAHEFLAAIRDARA